MEMAPWRADPHGRAAWLQLSSTGAEPRGPPAHSATLTSSKAAGQKAPGNSNIGIAVLGDRAPHSNTVQGSDHVLKPQLC